MVDYMWWSMPFGFITPLLDKNIVTLFLKKVSVGIHKWLPEFCGGHKRLLNLLVLQKQGTWASAHGSGKLTRVLCRSLMSFQSLSHLPSPHHTDCFEQSDLKGPVRSTCCLELENIFDGEFMPRRFHLSEFLLFTRGYTWASCESIK